MTGLDPRWSKCLDCGGWYGTTNIVIHRCPEGVARRARERAPRFVPVYEGGIPVRMVWVEPEGKP